MGHFETSVSVMQKAVNDINAAKHAIRTEITANSATSEGTIKAWQGSGGNTLRSLMSRYDTSANALWKAIETFEMMVDEQAKTYGINDADQSDQLTTAGAGLNMG